ncbi:MAG: glycoside hydrolase family 25 [Clostridium sp.]|nr:glycoside hydrolase family 25 [Clostridium sp.]
MKKHNRKPEKLRLEPDDLLDLDNETVYDETDTDIDDEAAYGEPGADWDDEAVYDESDEDIDDDYDLPPLADKRLLYGIAAAGAVILAVLIVVFAVHIKKTQKEREDAIMLINPPEIVEVESSTGQGMDIEEEADTAQNTAEAESQTADNQAQETGATQQTSQTQVSVGALDDEQDPQDSGAAGNEENGAEVTVSKREDETSDTTLGIDVSKYQGTIDWAKVKASGVDFAMIRVGYRAKSTGEIFEDPTARYNMQEAQAAGVMIGAYFFSSAVTKEEAKEEAAFTKDIIAKYKITYPVAFNCEDFQSSDSRQYGLDIEARTALACAFLDEIAAAGYTPMFYASKGELDGNAQWNTQTLSSKYKIWVAQYPDKPYPETASSSYAGTHDMWQYTSQGIVDGINRKADVNVAYFGYTKEAAAKDETPAETVEANPEVGINFTEVNETVTAKQETNLRSEPSTLNDDSIVTKLVHGDTATRTGIGHNGWSRVIYNGQTLYAVTSYLTTDMEDTGQQAPPQGPIYTPVNEQVTAKMETNLRTEPSTASDDTIVGKLYNGETLTRIAVGDNGWSQLDYNGQTVYAVSSYLMVQ